MAVEAAACLGDCRKQNQELEHAERVAIDG